MEKRGWSSRIRQTWCVRHLTCFELLAVNVSDIRRVRSQVPVSSLYGSLKQGAVLYFKLFLYRAVLRVCALWPALGAQVAGKCDWVWVCVIRFIIYYNTLWQVKESVVHVTPVNLRGLPPSRARQDVSLLACGPTTRGALGCVLFHLCPNLPLLLLVHLRFKILKNECRKI